MTSASKVYIRDKKYSWIPATIVSTDKASNTAVVVVDLPEDWVDTTSGASAGLLGKEDKREVIVKLSSYPGGELPRQNIDENGKLLAKSDMVDLPNLHEAGILYNLKELHTSGIPYSRVGDIVVAMNPFRRRGKLYTKEKQESYAKKIILGDHDDTAFVQSESAAASFYKFEKSHFEPHIYETSSRAYSGLYGADASDQTILVSGESGAGKTETVKIVMSHLTKIANFCHSDVMDTDILDSVAVSEALVTRILDSNPVFEAFGNATTLRNDNSSRFGKYTQLKFQLIQTKSKIVETDQYTFVLCGADCTTYLLEKSRVVSHVSKERNFNIFYQLLASPTTFRSEVWDVLANATAESFRYIGTPAKNVICGKSDAQHWTETQKDLCELGISGDKFLQMMRALCVVMQLGNIIFGPDPANDDHTIVSNTDELEKLSEIMGMPASLLNAALTERTMTARGESHKVMLKVRQAMDARDALAKEIYARLFDWLVKFINAATLGEKQNDNEHSYRNIGLLDLFGFEAFDVNRFEQLCINYANEKLQYKYARDNFRSLQEEYEAEGIDLFDFASVDNSSILNLIESRLGLFAVLNEECVLPNGNAKSFVYKAKKVHKDQPALVKKLLHGPSEFGIKHFAGDVVYDASEFIACNKDSISVDLIECASKSSNSLISDEFIKLSNEKKELSQVKGRRGAIFNQMTCTKFKSQVTSLMAVIDQSRTQFIRCIKPNKSMKPYVTDHTHTLVQLSSAGLLTAITILRESYPDNIQYEKILERFQCLAPNAVSSVSNLKDQVSTLLSTVLDEKEKVVGGKVSYPFALGKTKVYFRIGLLETLESDRLSLYTKHVLFIQSCVRRNLAMSIFSSMKEAVTLINMFLRAHKAMKRARNHYLKFLSCLISLQSLFRQKAARKSFTVARKAVTRLQAHIVGKRTRKKYLKCLTCTISLQSWFRQLLAKCALIELQEVSAARYIQKRWQCWKRRKEFCLLKYATLCVQKRWRSWRATSSFSKLKNATLIVQKWLRGWRLRNDILIMKNAVLLVQKWWRSWKLRIEFLKFKNATLLVQKVVRKAKHKMQFTCAITACVESARKDHARIKVQEVISQELTAHNSSGVDPWLLLDRCDKIMDDLSGDLFEFRSDCSTLKEEVLHSNNTIRHLNTALEYSEAACKAIKSNCKSQIQKLKEELHDSQTKINCQEKVIESANESHLDYKRRKEKEILELRHMMERNRQKANEESESKKKEVDEIVSKIKMEGKEGHTAQRGKLRRLRAISKESKTVTVMMVRRCWTWFVGRMARKAKTKKEFESSMTPCFEDTCFGLVCVENKEEISQELVAHNSTSTDPWSLLERFDRMINALSGDLFEVKNDCSALKEEVRQSKETILHLYTAIQYSEAAYKAIKSKHITPGSNIHKPKMQLHTAQ